MVEVYQEILSEVIARNEELRQEGMSTRRRIKHLTQFAKEISGPIAERTRSTELQLKLMRENKALKEKIDRYTHTNVILPLPLYLLGLQIRGNWRHFKRSIRGISTWSLETIKL